MCFDILGIEPFIRNLLFPIPRSPLLWDCFHSVDLPLKYLLLSLPQVQVSGNTYNTVLNGLDSDTIYTVTVVPVYSAGEGQRMSENGKTRKSSLWINTRVKLNKLLVVSFYLFFVLVAWQFIFMESIIAKYSEYNVEWRLHPLYLSIFASIVSGSGGPCK